MRQGEGEGGIAGSPTRIMDSDYGPGLRTRITDSNYGLELRTRITDSDYRPSRPPGWGACEGEGGALEWSRARVREASGAARRGAEA